MFKPYTGAGVNVVSRLNKRASGVTGTVDRSKQVRADRSIKALAARARTDVRSAVLWHRLQRLKPFDSLALGPSWQTPAMWAACFFGNCLFFRICVKITGRKATWGSGFCINIYMY